MPPAIMMMMKMTKRTMIFETQQNQEKWRHFHEKINKCNTAIYFFSFVIIESSITQMAATYTYVQYNIPTI